MAKFRKLDGKTKKVYLPVTTSLALAEGSLVETTAGLIAASDDNDTQIDGVLGKTILSTDTDYAVARLVPVTVPVERHVIWEASGQSGFTSADIGGEYGISSSTLLDQADTTNKVFKVTAVRDAGATVEGYLKINGGY